ncbi:energy transducer TonB [Alloprevotella sp. OH1205_COT-284]|nr:energy transducer TonB [Alloprevotella sp. OH1205_COT-284]
MLAENLFFEEQRGKRNTIALRATGKGLLSQCRQCSRSTSIDSFSTLHAREFNPLKRKAMKLLISFTFLFVTLNLPSVATCTPVSSETVKIEQDTLVYTHHNEVVGTPPQYVGGEKQLLTYVQKATRYPASCVKKKVTGRVVVRFTVTTKGRIRGVHVLKSSGNKDLDAEAVRVASSIPGKWKPGLDKKGRKIATSFNLPFRFMIQ